MSADFSRMDKYLAQPAVRAKLGVPLDLDFQECSLTVNAGFASDYARDFSPNVQDMLNGHLKVLIYAGGPQPSAGIAIQAAACACRW